jgi:hypothetical protein
VARGLVPTTPDRFGQANYEVRIGIAKTEGTIDSLKDWSLLKTRGGSVLSVFWCYIQPRFGFSAINTDVIGAPCFHDFSEAESHATSAGIRTSQSKGDSAWIRFEHDDLWIHYEYSGTNWYS